VPRCPHYPAHYVPPFNNPVRRLVPPQLVGVKFRPRDGLSTPLRPSNIVTAAIARSSREARCAFHPDLRLAWLSCGSRPTTCSARYPDASWWSSLLLLSWRGPNAIAHTRRVADEEETSDSLSPQSYYKLLLSYTLLLPYTYCCLGIAKSADASRRIARIFYTTLLPPHFRPYSCSSCSPKPPIIPPRRS
jgi:hypothetical protein